MEKKTFDICERTFEFSVRIVNLCVFLGEKPGARRDLSKQLIRSGTSVGANIEEAQSAQSTRDFIHKLEISLKEARETRYWLKLLIASDLVEKSRLSGLLTEIEEIIKILSKIIVNKKKNSS